MRYVRFVQAERIREGVLEGEVIRPLSGSMFGDFSLLAEKIPLGTVRLLAPCQPGKILCVGLNYRDHAEEFGLPLPKWPVIFTKAPTTVVGPGENIVYPAHFVTRLDYEAELAVVIRKVTKNVSESEAAGCILGYTCANDVTARNLQPKEGQWAVAKSFDTFLPLGPAIVAPLDPGGLEISCLLNGELKQGSNTQNLIFDVPYLVSYLSKVMTLLPGDVIITGTPSGVGPMVPGDEVTVAIQGIGELTNRVVQDEGETLV